jgi:hypothetical protein
MRRPFFYQKFVPLLATMLFLVLAYTAPAQSCEKLQSSQIHVTDALCEGGGAIEITGLSEGQYTILTGPGIEGQIRHNDNNYIKLNQGTFDLLLYCPGSTTPTEHSVTIADKYSPLQLSLTSMMDCPGQGTISAAASQGYNLGGAGVNYQFAMWKSNLGAANRPDADLTYGSVVSWSNLAEGTYYVRVKDNCDNFITETVVITPKSPRVSIDPNRADWKCLDDGGRKLVVGGVLVDYNRTAANGMKSPESFPGAFSFSVYAYKSGETCSTSADGGTLVVDNRPITNVASMEFTLDPDVTGYKIVVSSACEGIIDTDCYQVPPAPAINLSTVVTSNCDNTARLEIKIVLSKYITTLSEGTLTITSGNPLFTTITVSAPSASNVIDNLNPAYAPYTITYTDKCGLISVITWDGSFGAAKLTASYITNCRDFGSVDVTLAFSGDVRGLSDADTKFELWDMSNPSAPSLVATITGLTDLVARTVLFVNIPAGKKYKVKVVPQSTGCASTELDLDIPANVGFNVTEGSVKVVYNCPTGNTVTFSGYSTNVNGYSSFYTITPGGSRISGPTLSNLAPGDYTFEYQIASYSGSCNVKLTGAFTITPPPAKPVITKLVAVTCQDEGGAPKTTGSAYISYEGNGPFIIEYKMESAPTYVIAASNVSATNYTLENLQASTAYVVRITDKCGNAVTQRAAIKPLTPFLITNKFEPCVNQPYTLSGVEIDFATYAWTKEGDPSFSSNAREVSFDSYSAANDGTYILTVTLPNNCVVTKTTITLTSDNCGQPFPLGSIGDYTWLDKNKDGKQDQDELALAGVTVSLEVYVGGPDGDMADNRNWTSIPGKPAQITDNMGKYLFNELPAGIYRVLFLAPSGYSLTTTGTEENSADDSNADKNTGMSQPITIVVDGVESGDIRRDNPTIDAGFIPISVLPVNLVEFKARLNGENAAILTWSTIAEVNSSYFQVEKSGDGKNWLAIGKVNSAGNSGGLKTYRFEDGNLLRGIGYYRLKMVDRDETYAYSRIANVELGGVDKLIIYPNPAKDYLYLKSAQEIDSSELISVSGKSVYKAASLSSDQKLSLPDLKPGIYILKVQYKSGQTEVRKIVVQ